MKLPLSPKNPIRFKQPFLCIAFTTATQPEIIHENVWYIDVDGRIDKYLTRKGDWFSPEGKNPKPLLIELCKMLASNGMKVVHFGTYNGSGGPTHILRCGALFHRMSSQFERGTAETSVVPTDFEPPTYSAYHW